MRHLPVLTTFFLAALCGVACSDESDDGDGTEASTSGMGLSFFVTSSGSGAMGGNLGGLTGADARCQQLAQAAGAGSQTWRAYLSSTTENARDRIGNGPWYNADGDMIAADVASLHTNGLKNGDPQHMMDENGDPVPMNEHDILTGSDSEGRLFMENGTAATCNDWSSNAADAPGPRVGHSDIPPPMFSPSWNNAHTPPGCTQMALQMVGGAGRLYCFAQ